MKLEYCLLFLTILKMSMADMYKGENCWENCFKVHIFFSKKKKERKRNRKRNIPHMKYTKVYDRAQFVAYNQIYKAGMEARKLKNYMNANGAAFFLDSSFDVFKKKPALNETENLFLLQKRIVRKKSLFHLFFFFFENKFHFSVFNCQHYDG